ncbi:TPA: hypothetical protein N0F65_011735 [Lagenidium giganteum]|uniref:Uncharacterized protein n=1 Tax=Lagenidium giganteum TaxID=4803 RepID=A0AAV2YHE7_9STRA|nr:TPA: hypothetical protein N0F65_011735 [Lagenidium giganteum]
MAVRPMMPLPMAMLASLKTSTKGDGDTENRQPFQLPNVTLRKVTPKPIFENFDGKAFLIKPPTQMMRFVDSLRYHKPTEDERRQYNVCSSKERLFLHILNDILVLCGARKGFRFNSKDINRLRTCAEELELRYQRVDTMFRSLPLPVSQYRFGPEIMQIEDDEALLNLMRELKGDPPPADEHSESELIRLEAYRFQWLARKYIEQYDWLRREVMMIRKRLYDFLESSEDEDLLSDLNEPVESEFEAKANCPFPEFLHVLIQKYHREERESETAWTPSCSEPPVESIAKFSIYLAGLIYERIRLTQVELHSMSILLQIMKISSKRVDHRIELVDDEHVVGSKRSMLTCRALRLLLFEFLSTVRELRLIPGQKHLLAPPRHKRVRHTKSLSITSNHPVQQLSATK